MYARGAFAPLAEETRRRHRHLECVLFMGCASGYGTCVAWKSSKPRLAASLQGRLFSLHVRLPSSQPPKSDRPMRCEAVTAARVPVAYRRGLRGDCAHAVDIENIRSRYACNHLGKWRCRCNERLLLGASWARCHCYRPPRGRGSRNELRKCRSDFPRLCIALGRAGHPSQGREVNVPEACASGNPPRRHCIPAPMDVADAAQLQCRKLRGQ